MDVPCNIQRVVESSTTRCSVSDLQRVVGYTVRPQRPSIHTSSTRIAFHSRGQIMSAPEVEILHLLEGRWFNTRHLTGRD